MHRANSARYMLNYAGVDYEERSYPLDGQLWKAEKETIGVPFSNLPYIIDGEHKLSESFAVQQYICHKYKPELLGSTP